MRRWPIAAILVGIASRGEAFVPHKADRPFVIASREASRARRLDTRVPAAAASAFASLAAAGWRASWDRDTGVPAWLWGGFVDVPGSVADPAIAERAARSFLGAHVDVLAPGARPWDFVLVANQLDGATRTVGFAQTANGMNVIGGQLGFVFENDRLFAIASGALPEIRVPTTPRTTATTMRSRAEAWVGAAIHGSVTTRAIGDRAILPIMRDTGVEYHVVDVLDVEARGEPGRWDVYVDADGTPLARRSRILFGSGTLVYDAGVRYPGGARAGFPAVGANIVVDGSAAVAGTDGAISWTGGGSATIEPGLASSTTVIHNQAGALATGSLTAQPGQSVEWSLAGDEVGDAQLSTFIYASQIKARDRIINPSIASWLDQALDFYVNEGGACNAFSTGDEVHFYRSNAQCENTGRLADVVYHEFGHSFHKHSIIMGMGAYEPSLSEGLADYNAANLTEDSAVGRGFFLTDGPLREIDPFGRERAWPDDQNDDAHITGEILSGALWDLRKALVGTLGHDAGVAQTEKIFTGIMQWAPDIPSSYMAALLADDNDGNLGNLTPNYCAIEHAFGEHGLVPGYETIAVGTHTLDGLQISVPVTTPTVSDCTLFHVVAVTVHWKVGDAASSFALVAQGNTWQGTFPAQPDGTVIQYTIEIAIDDGSTKVFPNNPADPYFQMYVGPVVPLYCETFDTDPHWTQTSNLLGDEWQWDRPGRYPMSGDPLKAFTGDYVFGTDITNNGVYRGGEITTAETPQIDVSAYRQVRLQYRRWLTVEDSTYDHATIDVNGTTLWGNAASPAGALDHIDKEWRFQDLDLTPVVADGKVKVTWTLSSDNTKNLGGWTLDDVCIVGISKIARCGDQVLDDNEQCDDGNTADGDGCSATCNEEITAGGGCCSADSHPAGSALLGAGVAALVLRRRRSRAQRA